MDYKDTTLRWIEDSRNFDGAAAGDLLFATIRACDDYKMYLRAFRVHSISEDHPDHIGIQGPFTQSEKLRAWYDELWVAHGFDGDGCRAELEIEGRRYVVFGEAAGH